MIIRKKLSELNNDYIEQINFLLLSYFVNSRLHTYDEVIYYLRNDKIIGFVGLQFDIGFLTVNQLCVHIDYRNNGIGSMILKYIENNLQSNLVLYIDKNNDNTDELYKFYIKRGYQEDDIDSKSSIVEYKMIKYSSYILGSHYEFIRSKEERK